MLFQFKIIDIKCENDIQDSYVQLMEHTVMCNAVRDHVGCLKILVSVSEHRQSEGTFGCFVSIFLTLVPERKFTEENKIF